MNPLTAAIRSRCQVRNHAMGDVNASFTRIKGACVPLECARDPIEWPNYYVGARGGRVDRRFW